MMEKTRLLFSGSGGQGVITAAILLAEAAVRFESLNAIQTQSYGAEARGGATRSDVIIWDKPIYFPRVTQANVLICLTQAAFNKYQEFIRPGGLLVTDRDLVKNVRNIDARQLELPFYEAVMDRIQNPVVLNICVLGAVVAVTGIVQVESVKKLIAERFAADFHETNFRAVELGLELVRQFQKQQSVS